MCIGRNSIKIIILYFILRDYNIQLHKIYKTILKKTIILLFSKQYRIKYIIYT